MESNFAGVIALTRALLPAIEFRYQTGSPGSIVHRSVTASEPLVSALDGTVSSATTLSPQHLQ